MIHINNYTKQPYDYITCAKGHQLVFCNGERIKHYFRHKHSYDVNGAPMSEWHSRMQSYFPITEHSFPSIQSNQIKNRRADVFVRNNNCVIEIQHSVISKQEVWDREHDYTLHDQTIIWLIDGNTPDIECEELTTGDYRIKFNKDWKWSSFQGQYEYILVDIQNKVFKIAVNRVCKKMILVKEWLSIDVVMEALQMQPHNIWYLWKSVNEVRPIIRIQQKGAGNGKTYGIWKSIVENQDKDFFLIVTKQHSAKTVIHKELNDQMDRNEWHIMNNMDKTEQDELKQKKIIIHYEHKRSLRVCKVIIATIDSFIWNLTAFKENTEQETKERRSIDYFKNLRSSISDNGITKVNPRTGRMRFAVSVI